MDVRQILPCALAVALASGGLATAAPKKGAPKAVCRLVVDAKGDQQVGTFNGFPVKGEPWSSDFDILSADLASNRKDVTAVVRLATLREPAADPTSPSQRYSLQFTAGTERFEMIALVGADGSSAFVTRETGFTGDENTVGAGTAEGIGDLALIVDHDRAEIRMTGPLSHFAPYASLAPGHQVKAFRAWSMQFDGKGGETRVYPVPGVDYGASIGGGGAASSTDRADSKATYTTGARSCVVVGK